MAQGAPQPMPEGLAPEQISMDTVLAEYGLLQIQLNAANRRVAALAQENATLRAALGTKQMPTGEAAPAAPRAQRRASDRQMAKLRAQTANLTKDAKLTKDADAAEANQLAEAAAPQPTPIRKRG